MKKFFYYMIAAIFVCAVGLAPTAASADSCFWMSTEAGNPWVPAPQGGVDKQQCFALDSCDGGEGMSGGGCYKWAASADAPRDPWFSCYWLSNVTDKWVAAPQGDLTKGQCFYLDSCDGGEGGSGGGCYKWATEPDGPRQPWK